MPSFGSAASGSFNPPTSTFRELGTSARQAVFPGVETPCQPSPSSYHPYIALFPAVQSRATALTALMVAMSLLPSVAVLRSACPAAGSVDAANIRPIATIEDFLMQVR